MRQPSSSVLRKSVALFDADVFAGAVRGKGLGGSSIANFYLFNRPCAEDVNGVSTSGSSSCDPALTVPDSLGKAWKSRVELEELPQVFDEGREVSRRHYASLPSDPDMTRPEVHPSTRRRREDEASHI